MTDDSNLESENSSSPVPSQHQETLEKYRTLDIYEAGGEGDCGPKALLAALRFEFRRNLGKRVHKLTHVHLREMAAKQRNVSSSQGKWWTDLDFRAAIQAFEKAGMGTIVLHVYNDIGIDDHRIQIFSPEDDLDSQAKGNKVYIVAHGNHFRFAALAQDRKEVDFLSEIGVDRVGSFVEFERGDNLQSHPGQSNPNVDGKENQTTDIPFESLDLLHEIKMVASTTKSNDPKLEDVSTCVQVVTRFLMRMADITKDPTLAHLITALLFFGGQSTGKSRLASAVLNVPAAFSSKDIATKAPVCYTALHSEAIQPEVSVNDKTVEGIIDISFELERIMEKISSHELSSEIQDVRVTSRDISASISVYDMIGLVTGGSEENQKMEQRARDISTNFYRDKIAPPKASSIAVMVNRLHDEYQNIPWPSIIQRNKYQGVDKIVICLTHGDRDLAELDEKNAFNDCRTLRDIWNIICKQVSKAIPSHKVPIFVTAADGKFDTQHVAKLVKEEGESDMMAIYNDANREANTKMLKQLHNIIASQEIGYTNEEYQEFLSHFGLDKFVLHLRQQQVKNFVKNIPTIVDYLRSKLNKEQEVLKMKKKTFKQLHDISPNVLSSDFFRIFDLLLHSILTGIPISMTDSFEQNPSHEPKPRSGTQRYDPTRPAPIAWIDITKWLDFTLDNLITMKGDIDFSMSGVPFELEMPQFPFSMDKMESVKLEKQFVDRYESASDPQIVGVARMKNLIREICSRLVWIDPGILKKDQLAFSYQSSASVSSSLDHIVNTELSKATNFIFKEQLAAYISRRFAAIYWHCITTVLGYMKEIPQFNSLATVQEGKRNFFDDAETVLYANYYQAFRNLVNENIMKISSRIDTLIDGWSPLFYELAPLLMVYDKNIVKLWIRSHPQNQTFSNVMTKVINENKDLEEIMDDKSDDEIDEQTIYDSDDDNGIMGMEKETLTGLKKFFSGKGEKFRSRYMFKRWENSARRFFRSTWSNDRLTSKEDCSDTIMYLMNMGTSPDTIDHMEQAFVVTENDLAKANFIYQRMFRSRVFDFMRMLYAELMKNTVYSQDITILSWRWQRLYESFKDFLSELETDSTHSDVTDDIYLDKKDESTLNENDSEKRTLSYEDPNVVRDIYKNVYGIESAAFALKKDMAQSSARVNTLKELLSSLQWFLMIAQKQEHKLYHLFSLGKDNSSTTKRRYGKKSKDQRSQKSSKQKQRPIESDDEGSESGEESQVEQ